MDANIREYRTKLSANNTCTFDDLLSIFSYLLSNVITFNPELGKISSLNMCNHYIYRMLYDIPITNTRKKH